MSLISSASSAAGAIPPRPQRVAWSQASGVPRRPIAYAEY